MYLLVRGLPAGEDMEARFERIGTGSIFSFPLGKRGGLEVLDEREDHLRKGENGAAGVTQFELKTGSGQPSRPLSTPSLSMILEARAPLPRASSS